MDLREYRFGWGCGRGLGDYVVPERRWSFSAGRVLEVYPGEEVSLPVWERGVQVSGELLGLSAELASDLIAWHQDLDSWVVGMDSEEMRCENPSRRVPTAELIEDHVYAARKRREAALRNVRYASRREFVEEFETRRDQLVERLRAELGPGFPVLTPVRIA